MTFFRRLQACTAILSALKPCSRPLPTHTSAGDSWTHRQVQNSLSWGHCSFLLGPGAQGAVCAPQESISQPCVSSGSSMVGLMATSSKRACTTPKSAAPRTRPCGRPLLARTSTGDAQTQFCLRLCEGPGSRCTQALFEPSEHLWREWGLILNANLPLLPSCWGCSFANGCGVSLLKTNSKKPFATTQL